MFTAAVLLGVRPLYASAALVAAFTAAWTWTAAHQNTSGLLVLGALLVAAGLSLATGIGSWITLLIKYRSH